MLNLIDQIETIEFSGKIVQVSEIAGKKSCLDQGHAHILVLP